MPEFVKTVVRDIPDFPKPGIIFKDVSTVLKHPKAFKRVIDFLTEEFKNEKIDYVAAIESRGFVFGAPLAYNLDAGLVIIRKPGKLPAKVERVSYDLEYGSDSVEIHSDAIEPGKRVLLLDDLLATGGTAAAACDLIKKVGGVPIGVAFAIELEFLNGREKLPQDIRTIAMVKY